MLKIRITVLSAADEQTIQGVIKNKLLYLMALIRTIAPEFDIEIKYADPHAG